MKKQNLKVSVPSTTTPVWKLLVRFSVDKFGPNSKLWGKTATEEDIKKFSVAFKKFYDKHRTEFPDSPEYNQLLRGDLEYKGVYAELLNKRSESEEDKINIYFENLCLLIQKETFHGPQRLASPPLEAYIYVGHNKLNIGKNSERDVLISGQD